MVIYGNLCFLITYNCNVISHELLRGLFLLRKLLIVAERVIRVNGLKSVFCSLLLRCSSGRIGVVNSLHVHVSAIACSCICNCMFMYMQLQVHEQSNNYLSEVRL